MNHLASTKGTKVAPPAGLPGSRDEQPELETPPERQATPLPGRADEPTLPAGRRRTRQLVVLAVIVVVLAVLAFLFR